MRKRIYLPILGIALQHQWVLGLRDLAIVLVLDLLGSLLGLDAVVLRESALVALSAGVGEEVRADGLDAALGRGGKVTNSLEILVGGPARRQDRKREVDLHGRHGAG